LSDPVKYTFSIVFSELYLSKKLLEVTETNGSFHKTSIPPPQRKFEVNPLPPSDVLIHLLLSETILSPLPLRTAEISSVGGVWIFSGTTQSYVYDTKT
jgi:hypothetical protein